jgi:hypothetical protein
MTYISRLVPLVIAAILLVLSGSHRNWAKAQTLPSITATRFYTGPDGQTHAEEVELKLATARAGMDQSEALNATRLQFARRRPGTVDDWHTTRNRQYAITLSGRGEFEVAGGKKVALEVGHVFLVEDLTGKGHITRTLGSEDWTVMVVNMAP